MQYSFNLEKLQDYIEDLCTKHRQVAHTPTRRCFARFESGDQVNEIKKAAGNVCVLVADINGHRTGEPDDKMLERSLTLRFAVYAGKMMDSSGAKAAAIHLAEEIMYDFMSRMEFDAEEDACGPMRFLKPENFSWEPIDDQPWLLNHYGWDLTIPFRHHMPAYNAENWND